MSCAGIISRILGFFYKIFLSRTIGASGLGLYQLIFPIFSLCLAISTSGIQTAISRFVAIEISKNKSNEKKARKYLYAGLLTSISICGFFTILVHTFAPWISNVILKEPRTEELLKIMSFTFIPAAIHSCFNGYFYGKKNSVIPSVCQILEQIARIGGTLLIFVVLSDQNLPILATHAVWGLVISECMGFLVCLTGFLGQKTETSDENLYENDSTDFNYLSNCSKNTFSDKNKASSTLPIKTLLCMAIPLSLNHVLMSLSNSIENMLIPQQLMAFGFSSEEALSHFGILTGMALAIIFFPAVITNSLSVLLLPRISEAKAQNDTTLVLDTIKGAAACGIAFGSLCTFFFLFSSDWIGRYIFDNAVAGFYVQILSILCPFMYTSGLLSSIVNGLGYAHLTLICNLSGCLVRILAIWIFMPQYGMYTYIFSLIGAALLTTVGLAGVVYYVVHSEV